MEGLDWESIEVGKQYQLEEGPYFQAEVEVIGKKISTSHVGFYVEYRVKVTRPVYMCKEGMIANFGKCVDPSVSYLTNNIKFKEIGSGFDYLTPGYTMEDLMKETKRWE
jgi:hypothetical protein